MIGPAYVPHVAELVAQLERDALRLAATLDHLAYALDHDAGAPYPDELTPAEAMRVSAVLAGLGVAGGALLERDLARTRSREAGA